MAKANTEIVFLVSSAGTGHFYSIKKNRRRAKMSVKKYDPIVRKHVLYEEKKLSKLKR